MTDISYLSGLDKHKYCEDSGGIEWTIVKKWSLATMDWRSFGVIGLTSIIFASIRAQNFKDQNALIKNIQSFHIL
jgi:hypothetical protein